MKIIPYVTSPSCLSLLVFVWLLCICCLHTHSVSSQCLDYEKSLLVEFKNNLTFTPDTWYKLEDWNQSIDCCNWNRVECDSYSGRFIGLDLSNFSITGGINNLSCLENLQLLDLSENRIQGSIPSWISSAKNLVELYLGYNYFNGSVDAIDWGKLVNLTVIDLSYNSLTGSIPTSIFTSPSLQQINFQGNKFSGKLNEFITTSSVLQYVDFSNNTLEGPIPESIFQWRDLTHLSLSSNRFNGTLRLVEILQRYKQLSSLYLSNNYFSVDTTGCGINSSFPQLQYLKLVNCNLHSLPEFLKNQSSLYELDLSMNQITGIVPMWIWPKWGTTDLTLNLSSNHFVEIEQIQSPNISSDDPPVLTLDLHSNNIHGTFPTLPFYIDYLDCSDNYFTSIHPQIGNSLSLGTDTFSFSNNNLHGSIPTALCNSTNLILLNLEFNHLKGTIPDCLISMKNLIVLNLRGNNLGGAIPARLEDQDCMLQTLDLNGNFLEGLVPPSLASCQELKVLDLGNNQLNDTFPCHLKSLTNLQVLILRSNKFHGALVCQGMSHSIWPMLQIVDLASNQFCGKLKVQQFLFKWNSMMVREIEEKSKPRYVLSDVDGNYYQNSVAVTLKGNTYELQYILTIFCSIDFSNNSFHGELPKELGNLNGLIVLNFSHNSFSGKIPPSIGNLSQIQSLDLSYNAFSEEIPSQLANLNFLEYLNLSFNKLSGRIPTSTQLQSFVASSYQGNLGLYGPPLTPINRSEDNPGMNSQGSDWSSKCAFEWMLMGAEVGFPVGIIVFLGPLLYIKRYREWYCNHLHILVMKVLRKEDHARGRRVRQHNRQRA